MNFPSSFSLEGRRAVVTGAAGRIGRAIADACDAAGADVLGVDIRRPDAAPPYQVVERDFSDPLTAEQAVQDLLAANGAVDIWVNAAYPRTENWGRKSAGNTPAEWQANVTMQLTAACVASAAVARSMAQADTGGAILNISSIYGLVAPDFALYEGQDMETPAAYAAIKGGLGAHTRYLAGQYGQQQVRVNALAPGGVFANQPEGFVSAYEAKTALGRMASEADIAGPALFLVSPAASYITGVVLPVDGGWTVY